MKHLIELNHANYVVIDYSEQPKITREDVKEYEAAKVSYDPYELDNVSRKQVEVKTIIHSVHFVDEYNHPYLTKYHGEAFQKLIGAWVTITQGGKTMTMEQAMEMNHNGTLILCD